MATTYDAYGQGQSYMEAELYTDENTQQSVWDGSGPYYQPSQPAPKSPTTVVKPAKPPPAVTPGTTPTTAQPVTVETDSTLTTITTAAPGTSKNLLMISAVGAIGLGLVLYFTSAKPKLQGLGHPGMLNRRGCHVRRSTGRVHCHKPSGWKKRK